MGMWIFKSSENYEKIDMKYGFRHKIDNGVDNFGEQGRERLLN